jgi:hypothetical protein
VATVVVGAAVLACGADATQPDVARVEATGSVPRQGPLGVMDAGLVGFRVGRNDEPDNVVVSHDHGHTWNAAELPGRPAALELVASSHGLYVDDELAAVVGRDAASASTVLPVAKPQFIVWTTTDGEEWAGHVLDTAGGLVGAPTVTAVGPLLVASASSAEGFNLFTSTDRGSSWRHAEVSGLDQLPGEDLSLEVASAEAGKLRMVVGPGDGGSDRRQILTSGEEGSTWSAEPCGLGCPDPIEAGDVIHRFGETSTDGGVTWHQVDVDPSPPGDGPVYLSTMTEVPGGWLASASRYDVGDVSYGMLLRSDDGRSWHQMLPPDPCVSADVGRPNSRVRDPIRFDGRWYVTYDCTDLSTPEFGVIYAGDAEAREFEPIEATERNGVAFGDPVVEDDHLLIPEFGEDELVAITTIG